MVGVAPMIDVHHDDASHVLQETGEPDLDAPGESDGVPNEVEDRPYDGKPGEVRKHQSDDGTDTGTLVVACSEHNDQWEVRHDRGDDVHR